MEGRGTQKKEEEALSDLSMFANKMTMPEGSSEDLADFISELVPKLKPEEVAEKVKIIVSHLEMNPEKIFNIIVGQPELTTISMLLRLSDKLHAQNQHSKLEILYKNTNYFNKLVADCSFNLFDLKIFLNIIPAYSDAIMDKVFSQRAWVGRILNADGDVGGTLAKCGRELPQYAPLFVKHLNEFNKAPGLRR